MIKLIFDTSAYISFFRQEKTFPQLFTSPQNTIYLSSVVAQELYAGIRDSDSFQLLDQLYGAFQKHHRILTPQIEEWRKCGMILSQLGQRHEYESIRKSRLVNDVMIALTCQKAKAILLTENQKDFQQIQEEVQFEFISV